MDLQSTLGFCKQLKIFSERKVCRYLLCLEHFLAYAISRNRPVHILFVLALACLYTMSKTGLYRYCYWNNSDCPVTDSCLCELCFVRNVFWFFHNFRFPHLLVRYYWVVFLLRHGHKISHNSTNKLSELQRKNEAMTWHD